MQSRTAYHVFFQLSNNIHNSKIELQKVTPLFQTISNVTSSGQKLKRVLLHIKRTDCQQLDRQTNGRSDYIIFAQVEFYLFNVETNHEEVLDLLLLLFRTLYRGGK